MDGQMDKWVGECTCSYCIIISDTYSVPLAISRTDILHIDK